MGKSCELCLLLRNISDYDDYQMVPNALGLDQSESMESLSESLNTNCSGECLENDVWAYVQRSIRVIAMQSINSKRKMEYQNNHPFSNSDCRTEWNNLTHTLFRGDDRSQYNLRTEYANSLRRFYVRLDLTLTTDSIGLSNSREIQLETHSLKDSGQRCGKSGLDFEFSFSIITKRVFAMFSISLGASPLPRSNLQKQKLCMA